MQTDMSCIMVIFGATGDLTKRKLIPALYSLHQGDFLPQPFNVVAVGRRSKTQEEFREELRSAVQCHSRYPIESFKEWQYFAEKFSYCQFDLNNAEGYLRLKDCLKAVSPPKATGYNLLFYLAVGPELFAPIVSNLHKAGLINRQHYWNRVIIEKPFGKSLKSARTLNNHLREIFAEEEIYRIDHYLGKEMIQNIMVLRFANIFFEPLWNNKFIDSVQISSTETVGVEDRAHYYEEAGALRDMVQNHMLQLLTLVAMEPPSSLAPEAIHDEKAKVLRSLKKHNRDEINEDVVRGQYGPGIIAGGEIVGYRDEKDVDRLSDTETFVAVKCSLENFRWAGTPFYLRTGKRMPLKSIEVVLQFKELPGILYFKEYGSLAPNLLIFRIAPREGVFLQLNAKKPGTKNFIVPVSMEFCQDCQAGENSPEAYERLLLDAMRGDSTLFTRWDEVENAWEFIDPIIRQWHENPNHPLFPNYAAGSWGPVAAKNLLLKSGRSWAQAARTEGAGIDEGLRYFHAYT